MHFFAVRWSIINQVLSLMFYFALLDFRQPWYGYPLLWEETTKSINSLSTPQRTYPISLKISSATIQDYDIIHCVLPIPPGAISSRSADGSPLKSLGFIRFALKVGNKSLPVEALVLPHPGPDVMLIDNSITKAFDAKLDWAAE